MKNVDDLMCWKSFWYFYVLEEKKFEEALISLSDKFEIERKILRNRKISRKRKNKKRNKKNRKKRNRILFAVCFSRAVK